MREHQRVSSQPQVEARRRWKGQRDKEQPWGPQKTRDDPHPTHVHPPNPGQ